MMYFNLFFFFLRKLVSIHRVKDSNEVANQKENVYYEITSVAHSSYQTTNIR